MKGYRTLVLNIVAMVGMLVTLLTGTETKDGVTVIQEHTILIIQSATLVWGIASVWLRALTDTPIFWGKDAARRPTNYRQRR
jgi:hypothetical protein